MLRAANPHHAGARELAEPQTLRNGVALRVNGEVDAFYGQLLAGGIGRYQEDLLYHSLQKDFSSPAMQAHAAHVLHRLADHPRVRSGLIHRWLAANDIEMAQGLLPGSTCAEVAAIQTMLHARSRMIREGEAGSGKRHPYAQVLALIKVADRELRERLVDLLAGFVRYDLRTGVTKPEKLVRQLGPIEHQDVRLSLQDVAREVACSALEAATLQAG